MKLQKKAITVIIWSEDYKELAKWYKEVLGFRVKATSDLSNDSFVGFDFGENWFCIGQHDKVSGQNKDPYRIMIEFYVESVIDTFNELKAKGVDFIAEPFAEPMDSGNWCTTAKDPEGNILQFYGSK